MIRYSYWEYIANYVTLSNGVYREDKVKVVIEPVVVEFIEASKYRGDQIAIGNLK